MYPPQFAIAYAADSGSLVGGFIGGIVSAFAVAAVSGTVRCRNGSGGAAGRPARFLPPSTTVAPSSSPNMPTILPTQLAPSHVIPLQSFVFFFKGGRERFDKWRFAESSGGSLLSAGAKAAAPSLGSSGGSSGGYGGMGSTGGGYGSTTS